VNRQSKKPPHPIDDSRFTIHGFLPIAFLSDWQVSAGDLSESLGPALFGLAALASVWVFHDARRREGFGARAIWAWALLTLPFPPAVLPLYLAARLYARRAGAGEAEGEEGEEKESNRAAGEGEQAEGSDSGGGEDGAAAGGETATAAALGFAPTLLYAALLLLGGGLYFYADYRSFEAHLARAERAKLRQRPDATIGEYRAALRVREDGHTRKLLGLELLQSGRHEEALAELLAAARAGEPDDALAPHLAAALYALGRRGEAADADRRFLAGPSCARPAPEPLCETARARTASVGER
jgi:tetratricopeptide (TPR) repeat protein